MGRKPRVHEPGSVHHVTAHGAGDVPLFTDDADRWRFLDVLGRVTREQDWRCLAFCVMGTHYHLLVEENETPLARPMHLLNARYARYVNVRHGRRGHVLDGRYRDTPVRTDEHLLAALRYLALNPCEAKLCESPTDWRWSSYAALIGEARPWSFVSSAWLLALFAPQREVAVERVRRYVEQVPGTVPVPGTQLTRDARRR